MTTIAKQIEWLDAQIKHMVTSLPIGVENGRISYQHAESKLNAAQATRKTLLRVRAMLRDEEEVDE